MRRSLFLPVAFAALLLACAVPSGHAATITHSPGDRVPPVVVSPAFGSLAAGGTVGANYIDFGVDYTPGNVEGVFNDGVLAFAGVNGAGNLDLLTAVDGNIVVPGTLIPGLTSFVFVEAGFAGAGNLLLEVFDTDGLLLDSVVNGPPLGPNGRQTMTIDRGGVFDIASFRVSTPGNDTFGVDTVSIEDPVAIPEPASVALFGLGVLGLGLQVRRRRRP